MSATQVRFEPDLLPGIIAGYPCENTFRVAFSGGADSTALLFALHSLSGELPHTLEAVHINHGYHADSDDWQVHCEDFCGELGVSLTCIKVEPDTDSGQGPEASLRNSRYAAFEKIIAPGDLLLMAHHRDDQAETLLLNLMRGSGIEGLAGIPESRRLGHGWLARPLLSFSRQSLEAYLESRGVEWLTDPGNMDDSMDRNFIRNQVLPLIQSRWPAAARSMARSAQLCRETSDVLAELTASQLDKHLCNERVLSWDPGLATRRPLLSLLLRSWTAAAGAAPIPASQLLEFTRQLSASHAQSTVEMAWQGWQVRKHGSFLFLQSAADISPCPALEWTGSGRLELGGSLGHLELVGADSGSYPQELRVQARKAGQNIRRNRNAPTQDVKELLRSSGIPPWLRDSIPTVLAGRETVCVGDWIISDEMRDWLDANGTKLRWSPREPVLEWLRHNVQGRTVESTQPVG